MYMFDSYLYFVIFVFIFIDLFLLIVNTPLFVFTLVSISKGRLTGFQYNIFESMDDVSF